MELKELVGYKHIAIQCHDTPDADAVGSGYALQRYLRSRGADAALVYGGPAIITKPNLLMFIDALKIKINHVKKLPARVDLLITVDCQHGAGNVQNLGLSNTARVVVIDHHRAEIPEDENTIIRPYLASCATLVWDLLNKADYKMEAGDLNALYFGLYSDTNGLSELRHPLDRDLADEPCDAGLVRKLRNASISKDELDIVAKALKSITLIGRIGLFKAAPCDPNLLGFTSDIAQQVVGIDCCVIYCLQPHGIKLSIRSAAREIMASEIANFICEDAGSGGGAVEKAGGFMSYNEISKVSGGSKPENYLKSRIREYLDRYDLVYADNNSIDFGALNSYKKIPLPVMFAKSTDVFPSGVKITIRTLEGDVDIITGDDVYLMIGILGEVYPIKRERFEASYDLTDDPPKVVFEYVPSVINRMTGERREILQYANNCVATDKKIVRAMRLKKHTKVFTNWDTDKYYIGDPSDWLVANEDNYNDCYIVKRDIFGDSYTEK